MIRILLCLLAGAVSASAAQPNILWLTSEDHGPQMGCYGDPQATTPNVDKLAARGLRYTRCWANAPVCAPARTDLITGMYPASVGGEHMRSMVSLPAGKKLYPQFLREAGYYCTNNNKEDFNVTKPDGTWDDSSKKAHWRNRARPDQPFFAVFNSVKSHESQIRTRPHQAVHDPAKVRVPAYHPDTPEVRKDWAQYYDQVSAADADAGDRLKELEAAGLNEETIVFYYADHGSGMPGSKRWPLDRGLHVPLVVYIPEKWKALRPPDYQAGGTSDRLVSFVDFAPTLLSLAGLPAPTWMEGRAFLGAHQQPAPPYLFGGRARMDERVDLIRSVTDGRYVYVRNYRPDLIYGQHLAYMWQTPTTRVWEAAHQAGTLRPEQDFFWKPKPPEELYDLTQDRDEVKNLASSPEHAEIKARLRAAQKEHVLRIRDLSFLPGGEMHARAGADAPYDMARNADRYPIERILETAELASMGGAGEELQTRLSDADAAVRFWAVVGLGMRKQAVSAGLSDASPFVRIAAAETCGRYGSAAERAKALEILITLADTSKGDFFPAMAALQAISGLGSSALSIAPQVAMLPPPSGAPHQRFGEYIPRLREELAERFP